MCTFAFLKSKEACDPGNSSVTAASMLIQVLVNIFSSFLCDFSLQLVKLWVAKHWFTLCTTYMYYNSYMLCYLFIFFLCGSIVVTSWFRNQDSLNGFYTIKILFNRVKLFVLKVETIWTEKRYNESTRTWFIHLYLYLMKVLPNFSQKNKKFLVVKKRQ